MLADRHGFHQLLLETQTDQRGRWQAPLSTCARELLQEGVCVRRRVCVSSRVRLVAIGERRAHGCE